MINSFHIRKKISVCVMKMYEIWNETKHSAFNGVKNENKKYDK